MSAILVSGLTKKYGNVTAVDGVSFQVPRGSITGLLGGNGAGKTTTIAMLLGLLSQTSGEITILDQDTKTNRYDVLQRMNFSSPYLDLPKKLTVRQNLSVYGRLYSVPNLKEAILEVAEAMHITEFLDRHYGKLSAGQQTRVALAKALINRPELLLLDEPTASLDPDTADRLRGYLEEYCKTHGMTILMASHNMKEVERLCDNVLMMRQGRIVDQGTPAELMERYGQRDMEEVFLHVARDGEASA